MRYWLFGYSSYYADGGMSDVAAMADSPDKLEQYVGNRDFYYILDTQTLEIVKSFGDCQYSTDLDGTLAHLKDLRAGEFDERPSAECPSLFDRC